MSINEQIAALLEEKFEEEEFGDCFIVEINQNNTKLEVFIDSDSNITFEKCRKVSRYLEQHLDENGWLGEKYILEVSSPGIGRPLVKRQYAKNIGRKLEVKLKEGSKYKGILKTVRDNAIELEEKVRVKEGKKKVNKILVHELHFDTIDKAIVKITF